MSNNYIFQRRKKPLSRLEFQKEKTRILKAMSAKTKPFADSSLEGIKKRVDQAKVPSIEGFQYFCLTYLPHYFWKPFGKIHRELIGYCLTGGASINAIAYPREHGKSTIVTFAFLLWKAVCGIGHFGIIVSDTDTLAQLNLSRIAIECEDNQRLLGDFGELVTPGEWREESRIVKNQYLIMALGWRQKIRGLTYMQYRPDFIVGDDLENDENVRNKKLVQEKYEWFLGAVYGSLDDDGTQIDIGTMLDKDCMLSRLIKMINEKSAEAIELFGIKCMNAAIYSAIIDEGTPNERPCWPEGKSLQKLKQRKFIVGPKVWAAEYQNKPLDQGVYKLEWIQSFDMEAFVRTNWNYYTGSDPSAKSDEKNDYKTHIVIALDPESKRRYVVESWIKHAEMDIYYDAFISLYRTYRPVKCGFEKNGYQEYLSTQMTALCKQNDLWPNIILLQHGTDKVARCSRWVLMFRDGSIFFYRNYSDNEILVTQLNSLGEKGHDDGPDGLDMAIEVSQGGAGSFEFQTSGQKRASFDNAFREQFYQTGRVSMHVRGEFL